MSKVSNLFYTGPSFQELHINYAKQGRIDSGAAIQAVDSIDINASLETVWNVLVDINKWPTFNPLVSDVRLESEIAVDAKGSFRLNGFPVHMTFAVVAPQRELTWTGVALWTKAIDRLTLEPLSDTSVRLRLAESLAGAFVPLMSSNKRLHQQHMASLGSFKKAAELLHLT